MLGIINRRVGMEFCFHYVIHGLYEGWGAGNASIEARLLQKVMVAREEVLYEVFPNLHKYYEALNRER